MIEIYLDFDEEDQPVISVKGLRGKGCSDLTKSLEEKLGVVIHETLTPEYYEREMTRNNERAYNKR